MDDEVFNIMKKSVEAMDAEEAYNAIKKSVEAINTRPYATLVEYEKVECIKLLLTAYEKQQKEIEELKYHIYYKTCKWCGDEFKTKSHNAKYCTKCRETQKREIRISNCKKHYENNKDYFKNYYQNLTDEQKERRRANNREANRRLRERKKCK